MVPAATLQIDPFAMFEKCVTIVSGLKDNAPAATGIEHIMTAFTKGIELSKTMATGGGEAGWIDIVKSAIESPALAEMVGQAIDARRAAQQSNGQAQVRPAPQRNPQQMRAQPNPAPQPEPQKIVQQQPDYAQQLNIMLLERLNYLVAKASANAAPELYAEWCIDNVPPDLARMIIAPGFLDRACEQLPTVAAHKEWFSALIVAMAEMLQGDPDGPIGAEPDEHSPDAIAGNQ
jgi:hypothetical protein